MSEILGYEFVQHIQPIQKIKIKFKKEIKTMKNIDWSKITEGNMEKLEENTKAVSDTENRLDIDPYRQNNEIADILKG